MEKEVLGSIEMVELAGQKVFAKVDTGAKRSSIDITLAKELKLTKDLWGIRTIKSASGFEYRPLIRSNMRIKSRKISTKFNLTDRSNLKYPVLIGKDVLKNKFLVDVSK